MPELSQGEQHRRGLSDTAREILLWLCCLGVIVGGWLLANYINW